MSPFDILNIINRKLDVPDRESLETDYLPFIINRGVSYFPDPECIFLSNEMNMASNLPRDIQFGFYYTAIDKKPRFGKWFKQEEEIKHKIEVLIELFNYSEFRARETVPLIDSLGIWSDLEAELYKGGKVKKKSK